MPYRFCGKNTMLISKPINILLLPFQNNNMKLLTSILLLSVACANVHAKNYEKIELDKSDNLYGYYLAVKSVSDHIQGVLVLLPGFGSPAESVFPDTRLHGVGYELSLFLFCRCCRFAVCCSR